MRPASANPFQFLRDLSDDEARRWLRRYLMEPVTDPPPVHVPFDIGHLEFLLAEITPVTDRSLPLRVGELAGTLLAEALAAGFATCDPRFLRALFALVESLPLPEDIVAFLHRLAVTGQLLSWPGDDDFHLVVLRTLVLHQPSSPDPVARWIDFWKREADDLRYASISIQGLLRIAPLDALEVLPDFINRASRATARIPLANLLFAVSVALADDQTLWRHLARLLHAHPGAFAAVKEGFQRIHLPRTHPTAWRIVEDTPTLDDMLEEMSVGSMRHQDVRYGPSLGRAA